MIILCMYCEKELTMTIISKENDYLTFINIFTVGPADQQKLIDLLKEATEVVRTVPGFVSSSLHAGLDGTKVTMYAQWKSIEDYNKMRGNPAAAPFLQQALEIASFEPGMYKVVETFESLK
jgi:quinol monooxygenase YgiN